jgi:hypothetical protein
MMIDAKRFSLVKPTLETPFKIDFDWWKQHDNNWRVFLYSYLCPEHQSDFANNGQEVRLDWVNPETAEVYTVDGLQHVLMTHCAKQPGFVTSNMPLVDSVFHVLLANGNEPMTPIQLGEATHHPSETILRMLSGMTVYRGIRPQHG